MRPLFPLRFAAVLAGALATIIAVLWAGTREQPTHTVGLGEPVRQDDFLYAVVGVAKSHALGPDGSRAAARGIFYVVTVEVTNRAVRVDYRWDPSIAYVVDAAGSRYRFSIEGQRALDATHPISLIIPPGARARFEVAFDLPLGVSRPQLAYSNGIMMGDIFDGAAYARARVPLD